MSAYTAILLRRSAKKIENNFFLVANAKADVIKAPQSEWVLQDVVGTAIASFVSAGVSAWPTRIRELGDVPSYVELDQPTISIVPLPLQIAQCLVAVRTLRVSRSRSQDRN
jgi:hypothetical protein